MNSKEEEYKEIFLAEALDNYEELNRLITELEKEITNKKAIDAIFRITHTLKGNAAGMGFKDIAKMAHSIEDLFGEVRAGKLVLSHDIFSDIFKAIDTLGALINALKTGNKVRYHGIRTKLDVILRKNKEGLQEDTEETSEAITTPSQNKEPDLPQPSNEDVKKEENKVPLEIETQLDDEIEEAFEEDEEEPDEIQNQITFSDLIQVPVRKLDNLLNLVGELIIERDRIISMNSGTQSSNEFSRLYRITSDLQYSVMDVRLVQVGFLFNKFHRVVRDAASVEEKRVTLNLEGTDTEIDRNILQIISDSLIHIIRNSVGHGIEKPAERISAGKSETGVVTLNARSESDAVIIEIKDDGKGVDHKVIGKKAIEKGLVSPDLLKTLTPEEINLYIFEPGFSSMEQVTAISGRGVGMDVVKRAMDSIGGNISVDTKINEGTTISLRLPSSMAVKGALLFELSQDVFAIPLTYTEAVVSLYKKDIHKVSKGLVATYLDKTISIVFLRDLFEMNPDTFSEERVLHKSYNVLHEEKKLDIVIVSHNNKFVGIVVDKLLQQKEIVEKPLVRPVDNNLFISGVTIMGNGNVSLVLNIPAAINFIFQPGLGKRPTIDTLV